MASLVCVACGHTVVDKRSAAAPGVMGDPTAPPVRPGTPAPSNGLPDDLTLEEPVLSVEGLAALGDAGFESELEHLRSQRRRQFWMLVLMGLSGLAFVVIVPVVVLVVGAARMLWSADLGDVPQLPVLEQPADLPDGHEGGGEEGSDDAEEASGDEEGAGDGDDAGEPPDEGEGEGGGGEGDEDEDDAGDSEGGDDDGPAPAPAPADPVRSLIQKGWQVASREPVVGAERFRQALELSPRHPEASYGLGYCLLKQGDLPGAQQHLCTARTSSKADTRRDVDALLANNGLSCSP